MAASILVLLCCAASSSPRLTQASGSYRVEFRGFLSGSGKASVNASSVAISGQLTSDDGDTRLFACTLRLNNLRFGGDVPYGRFQVRLNGRIEPPDGTLHVGRLVCTYRISNGKYGRIVGAYRG